MEKHDRTGFTLMEMLIVVMTIGILAAMIVPKLTKAQADTRAVAAGEDIMSIVRAVESFHAQSGYWPASVPVGEMPPELVKFFKPGDDPFRKICPIRGTYSYDKNKNTKSVFIGIRSSGNVPIPSSFDAQALDSIIDDGVLDTGRFRKDPEGYAYRVN